MRAVFSFRLTLIGAIACVIAMLLVGRLYLLQIVRADEYRSRAAGQYVKDSESLYDRGSIFFKDKMGNLVSAATLRSGYTIAINPEKLLPPAASAYAALKTIIPSITEEEFLASAAKTDDPYEEVAKRVTAEQGEAVKALKLKGLDAYRERWRYYPGDQLAAHTVGFVAYDEDSLTGRYGIERVYNDTLTRTSATLYVNFFAEVFANLNKTFFSASEKREGDVVTTIEPSAQLYLEKMLAEVHAKWSSKTTGGIIMNPKTGEIYALAALPSFNVNEFDDVKNTNVFINPLVENVYEFGSIVKPLTIASALDAGAIRPETEYNDKGHATYDGKTISNYDGRARGVVPMQQVLSQSLNTGVAFAVEKMGTDVFRDYLEKLGFSEETGIDLPNEATPLTDNITTSPRMIEYVTASYGQGIALTPVGMARSLSALATGSVPTPHVASGIVYGSGITSPITWEGSQPVFKEKTNEDITRMLVEVVDTALLQGKAKQERYSIAAKTGTAQIASPEGGYYPDRYLHSFFGYFPAYDAKFLVFLFTVEPKGVSYASETLTTPFLDISKFLLSYYEIPPDR